MSGILLSRDGNANTNKLFILEAELIKVSTDITIIGTFKTVEGGMHCSDYVTAFNGELFSERSPHQSNSSKVEEFGECRVMKFLSQKMTGFCFVVQPGSLFVSVGSGGRLRRGAVKMAKNLLFLEGPLETDGEYDPIRTICLEFGD